MSTKCGGNFQCESGRFYTGVFILIQKPYSALVKMIFFPPSWSTPIFMYSSRAIFTFSFVPCAFILRFLFQVFLLLSFFFPFLSHFYLRSFLFSHFLPQIAIGEIVFPRIFISSTYIHLKLRSSLVLSLAQWAWKEVHSM
jgi:hypothetical protein